MLAIITGTIRPAARMQQLALRDVEERLSQYRESIQALINAKAFTGVVFCENSGYGTESLMPLQKEAEQNKVPIELLSFSGDENAVCLHGKGYGEGEIMKYVFSRSELIQKESCFVKITGRLMVDNIRDIVDGMNAEKTYFNIPNRTIRDFYDTRIYGMPTEQFRDLFLESYVDVQDNRGEYLEVIYTRILKENGIRVYNFPRYPRLRGISGTSGIRYGYTEWKCKIRDILSKGNYYTIKR